MQPKFQLYNGDKIAQVAQQFVLCVPEDMLHRSDEVIGVQHKGHNLKFTKYGRLKCLMLESWTPELGDEIVVDEEAANHSSGTQTQYYIDSIKSTSSSGIMEVHLEFTGENGRSWDRNTIDPGPS